MKGDEQIRVGELRFLQSCGLIIKPVHRSLFCVLEMGSEPEWRLIIPLYCPLSTTVPIPLHDVNNGSNTLKRSFKKRMNMLFLSLYHFYNKHSGLFGWGRRRGSLLE